MVQKVEYGSESRIWQSQRRWTQLETFLSIFSQSWPHELLWLVLLVLFIWSSLLVPRLPHRGACMATSITYLLAGWLRKIGLWLSFVTVTFAHSTLEDDGNCCQNSAGANSVIV